MPFEEDESELADLELVPMVEEQPIDSFLIDICAVQRTCVADDVTVWGTLDLDVTA